MSRSYKDEFTKAVKIAAFQRSNGHCECGCGVKIIAGDGPEYDHIIEVALGGDNSLENCRVLRRRCHEKKTAERRPALDKSRRIYENRIKVRPRKSKPLPGSKASGWKHKMTGEWERR